MGFIKFEFFYMDLFRIITLFRDDVLVSNASEFEIEWVE